MVRPIQLAVACVLVLIVTAGRVQAGLILFATDTNADTAIVGALIGDGHTVIIVTNESLSYSNLTGPLGAYDAVYWSTHDSVTPNSVLTNLTNYVTNGGHLFVTGYDSTASPDDLGLRSLVAGTTLGSDFGPVVGRTMINVANSITTGVVDIRGQTITNHNGGSDYDTLSGIDASTVNLFTSGGTSTTWTLRTLGSGEVAYISSSNSNSEAGVWGNTSTVWNGVARNFAFNASTTSAVPEPSSLAIFGIGAYLMGIGVNRRRRREKQQAAAA